MAIFFYNFFALNIESELELPGVAAATGQPDVWIRRGTVPPRQPTTPDSERGFTIGAGKFLVRGGNEIIVDAEPGADPALLRTIVLGRAMAFLLRQRGWLPLHASAVAIESIGVLFLGASGRGKSTTAAAFYRRGHAVVSDDIAPTRAAGAGCELKTGQARLKLLDESLSIFQGLNLKADFVVDKHCFELSPTELPPVLALGSIYVLQYGDPLRIEPVRQMEAVTLLSEHTFFSRHRAQSTVIAAHLRHCTEIAARVPVCRLIRPRSLAVLPDVVRLVEDGLNLSDIPQRV